MMFIKKESHRRICGTKNISIKRVYILANSSSKASVLRIKINNFLQFIA